MKDKDKEIEKWLDAREHTDWLLPDYVRAGASCYLDWIAPSLYRHRDSEMLLELGRETFQMIFISMTQAGKLRLLMVQVCRRQNQFKKKNKNY